MGKIDKILDELFWFWDAVFGVIEQFLEDAFRTIGEIIKIVFYFVILLPFIMMYRWLTRKDYEQ